MIVGVNAVTMSGSQRWSGEQGGAGGKAGMERTRLGGEGDREESGMAAGFQLGLAWVAGVDGTDVREACGEGSLWLERA